MKSNCLLNAALALWSNQPYASHADVDNCILCLEEYANNNSLSHEELETRCLNYPEEMFNIIYHVNPSGI